MYNIPIAMYVYIEQTLMEMGGGTYYQRDSENMVPLKILLPEMMLIE